MNYNLHVSFGSGVHPGLDVRNCSHSLVQGDQLGVLGVSLLGKVAKVHEHMCVGPGQVVANKVLSSSALTPPLQVSKSSLKSDLSQLQSSHACKDTNQKYNEVLATRLESHQELITELRTELQYQVSGDN
mgnify:CR=1 FL=1